MAQTDQTQTTDATDTTTPETDTSKPDADGNPTGAGQVAHTQAAYDGSEEAVDGWLHTTRLVCGCGAVRWLAPGDVFQVDACKPCVEARRKEKRNARARRKRAERRQAKATAASAA